MVGNWFARMCRDNDVGAVKDTVDDKVNYFHN